MRMFTVIFANGYEFTTFRFAHYDRSMLIHDAIEHYTVWYEDVPCILQTKVRTIPGY